jgi:hypothetical protein
MSELARNQYFGIHHLTGIVLPGRSVKGRRRTDPGHTTYLGSWQLIGRLPRSQLFWSSSDYVIGLLTR